MTARKREFRASYGDGVKLTFRMFEGDERGRYDKELAKIRGTRGFEGKFDKLIAQVATKLLVGWEGVMRPGDSARGEDPEQIYPVALTPEDAAAWIADPESRKYWHRPVSEYLYPPREEDELELPEGEDPNF